MDYVYSLPVRDSPAAPPAAALGGRYPRRWARLGSPARLSSLLVRVYLSESPFPSLLVRVSSSESPFPFHFRVSSFCWTFPGLLFRFCFPSLLIRRESPGLPFRVSVSGSPFLVSFSDSESKFPSPLFRSSLGDCSRALAPHPHRHSSRAPYIYIYIGAEGIPGAAALRAAAEPAQHRALRARIDPPRHERLPHRLHRRLYLYRLLRLCARVRFGLCMCVSV